MAEKVITQTEVRKNTHKKKRGEKKQENRWRGLAAGQAAYEGAIYSSRYNLVVYYTT